MQTESNQEPTIDININGTTVTLLGTAHISQASVDKVQYMMESGDYDSVAVELCKSRHNAIVDPDAWTKMDLFQVIREGKAAMVTANLALGAFQQRMAEQLDIKPGAEMRMALEMSDKNQIPLMLIDREIGTTLKRIYRNVPWWQRLNLLAGLLASVISKHEVSEEEIEKLKEGDILESTFAQFAEEAEMLYIPLVDERDRYMSSRIIQEVESNQYKKLLVVIGAGHMNGMAKYINQWTQNKQTDEAKLSSNETVDQEKSSDTTSDQLSVDQRIQELDTIPLGNQWLKYIPWIIVILIFAGFYMGFSRSSELGWQLIMDWVLINGGLAALGALIAFAHPLTVIGAFIAAPITSLNPTIGAGMVTAAIEIWLRKPKVIDFTKLRSDTTHIKGWWQNRVTRTLLVFLFSTIGSAIGTYTAGIRIFERLF